MVCSDEFVHHATTLMPNLCPHPPKPQNLSDMNKVDTASLWALVQLKKKVVVLFLIALGRKITFGTKIK